jgi:hypothetical protein
VLFFFFQKIGELREIPELRKIERIGSGLPAHGTKNFHVILFPIGIFRTFFLHGSLEAILSLTKMSTKTKTGDG